MSKDRLLSALKASESLTESEKNFDDTKPKIKFSKPRPEKNLMNQSIYSLNQKQKRLEKIFMKQKMKIIFLHQK